jgi:Uma2 family endonuclease
MSTTTAERYHVELIGGVEREKPTPKRLHWILQRRILFALAEWELRLQSETGNEVDVRCGADLLVPDVAVMVGATYDKGVVTSGMLLAVEIMSPGQTIGELFDKCERLHAGGVPYCWVIHPAKRMAWEYHAVRGVPVECGRFLTAGEIQLTIEPLFLSLPED